MPQEGEELPDRKWVGERERETRSGLAEEEEEAATAGVGEKSCGGVLGKKGSERGME